VGNRRNIKTFSEKAKHVFSESRK